MWQWKEAKCGGYYVMGRHTSVAWCVTREEADRTATLLNAGGGPHYYTVKPR